MSRPQRHISFTIAAIFLCALLSPCRAQSNIQDFDFGDPNVEQTGNTGVSASPVANVDDAENEFGESGSTSESGAEPTETKQAKIVYYRVKLNITSVEWSSEFTQRSSTTFRHYANLISKAIENLYGGTDGTQLATVIQFISGGKMGGIIVSVDLGTQGFYDKDTINELIETAASRGNLGTFQTSRAGFAFTELPRDYIVCPDNVGREPTALTRTGNNWGNLLINNVFPCDGFIVAWEYFRLSPTGVAYVDVWRQIGGTKYALVSKTLLPETDTGVKLVKLPKPIAVKQNDFIGVHYPKEQQDGVIASASEGSGTVPPNELYNNYLSKFFDEDITELGRLDIDLIEYDAEKTTFALRAIMDYHDKGGKKGDRGDITVITCRADEFTCADGSCIMGSYRCDNETDCNDKSDELDCPTARPKCLELQCQSGGNECYSLSARCDGTYDCIDGSDEANCGENVCTDQQIRCPGGKCISSALRCDSRADCPDGSDEYNCPTITCKDGEFRCENGACISSALKCDGKVDCTEGSDELDCPTTTCAPGEFRCDNGVCIEGARQCDKHNDCADGSDEKGCPTLPPECLEGQFRCTGDGACISPEKKCDGVKHCSDNSDESIDVCGGCKADEFRCNNGMCISAKKKCNQYPDCFDGEDEVGCVEVCTADQFKCVTSGECISNTKRCDRILDCNDRTDEDLCDPIKITTSPGELVVTVGERVVFDCEASGNNPPAVNWVRSDKSPLSQSATVDKGRLTITSAQVTDSGNYECQAVGVPGVIVGRSTLTVNPPEICEGQKFRCNNGLCLDAGYRCDGTAQCAGGEDEDNCAEMTAVINPSELVVQVGADAVFLCTSAGTNGSVKWTRSGAAMPATATDTNGRLVIQGVTLADSGEYICSVTGQSGTVDARASLTVKKRVTVVINPELIEVHEGGDAVFDCRASGPTALAVTWDKSLGSLPASSSVSNGKLTIPNAKLGDAGDYVCSAVGVPGSVIGIAKLVVHKESKVLITPNELVVPSGTDAVFLCRSDSPTGTVKWSRDGAALPASATETDGRLVIQGATVADSGQYRCSVTGATGTVDAFASLTVQERLKVIISPDLVQVSVGGTAVFDCRVTGPSASSITWDKSLGSLPAKASVSRGRLTIPNTELDDAGNYVCSAVGVPGSVIGIAKLVVEKPVKVIVSPLQVRVRVGETAIFTCQSTGSGRVFWKKVQPSAAAAPVSAEGRLVIKNAQPSDAGDYECGIDGVPGGAVGVGRLIVEAPNKTCKANEFQCGSGECIDARRRCNRRRDCADSSDEHDCRTRRCRYYQRACSDGFCIDSRRWCDGRADCQDGSDERRCVTIKPTVTIDPRQQNVFVGENAVFLCRVSESSGASVYWYKPGGDLPASAVQNNGQLRIQSVTPQDSGRYVCSTRGIPTAVTATAILTVQAVPKITIDPIRLVVRVGERAVFRCSVSGDRPPSLKWSRRDGELPQVSRDERGVLTIPSVTVDDAGTYVCSAVGVPGSIVSTSTLVIDTSCRRDQFTCENRECVPSTARCDRRDDCSDGSDELGCRVPVTVTTAPGQLRVRVGQSILFHCQASGNPPPKVVWSRVRGSLPARASDVNGILKITQVKLSDSGRYQCRADGGSNIGTSSLIVEDISVRPTTPIPTIGPCGQHQTQCDNGQCIPLDYRCDGETDCQDGSDEFQCVHLPCEPNEFRCSSGKCVMTIWRCDGDNDCGDGSDELNCGTTRPGAPCEFNEYQCSSGDQCVPLSYHCDGEVDCRDRSDEIGCVPPTIIKPPVQTVRVEIGGTFSVVCEAVGVPTPLIVWRLNWGFIPTGARVVTTTSEGRGSLTIRNVVKTDEGAYTCEAINVKGSVFATPDAILIIRVIHGLCEPPLFHAAATHKSQCLSCFCFGITEHCYSTEKYLSKIVLGNALTLVQRSASQYTPVDGSVINYVEDRRYFEIIDFDNVLRAGSYFWSLPDYFLGNQLLSYNGELKYDILFKYPASQRPRPTDDPDIIIVGNGRTIYYKQLEPHKGNEVVTYKVKIFESVWRDASTREPISRPDLMMVLQQITAIYIRATYDLQQTETRLGMVFLTTAVTRDTGLGRAVSVEQCSCPTGYDGISCERCASGFYRVRRGQYLGACIPCQCNDHSNDCDPRTGICANCQHFTMGDQCELCIEGYYGDARLGTPGDCKVCACPLTINTNRFSPTCRLDSDGDITCTACPRGYTGRKCERCAPGYVGNPLIPSGRCVPRNVEIRCDPRGSLSSLPDRSGRCRCKEHVEGERCDKCKPATYYLSAENAYGCLPCFCMGTTTQCTSSPWYRSLITLSLSNDEHGVTLTDMMRRRAYSEGLVIRNQKLFFQAFSQLPQVTLYWSLPDIFLGNQVTAYGGYLRFTVSYEAGTDQSLRSDPDVEIIGNGITLVYKQPATSRSTNVFTVEVPIYEQHWRRSDGSAATREHLLMALSGVSAILIRATYTASTVEASISDISLDSAQQAATGRDRAFAVEQCSCPRGYHGLSCQHCASGYTRTGGGLYLGLCTACQCHGHARDCDRETGVCRNCDYNTRGDHCELCAPGYYGDATRGSTSDCQRCPCPLTQSPNQFSPTCVLDRDGQVTCNACPVGHTGRRCERCVAGYTGNPLKPGSYCRKRGGPDCDCDPRGTVPNTVCDESGHCQCKAHTSGHKCNKCNEGFFNLVQENDEGCTECYCMGITHSCTSAGYYRSRITPTFGGDGTHNFGLLTRRLGRLVVTGFLTDAEANKITYSFFAGLQRERESLYFTLPPRFRGDKITSYGGYLKFTVLFDSDASKGRRYADVDLEIISGETRLYLLFNPQPQPKKEQRYEILLVEDTFRLLDGTTPNRGLFLSTLANIEHILIRATHNTVMRSFSLSDLSLDIAVPQATSLGRVHTVESCTCPDGYTGLSCQSCAAGYLRARDSSTSLGRCVRCNCHGHASSCDPLSGQCLNCQDNTVGDRCDKCKDGFYGDATSGTTNDCRPCPCPLTNPSNQFSPTCFLDRDGQVTCDRCQQGYTGRDCGRCSPDYRGNPREPNRGCIPGTVNRRPSVTVSPARLRESLTSTATFYCQVSGPGTITVTWARMDGRGLPQRSSIDDDHSLTIKGLLTTDSARYICRASNSYGTSQGYADLSVIPGNQVSVEVKEPKTISARPGQNIQFACVGISQIREVSYTIAWTRLGANRLPDQAYDENGILYIPNIRPQDSGTYVCTGSNIFGTDSDTATVTVQEVSEVPRVQIEPRYQSVKVGERVVFRCSGTGIPPPTIEWTKGGSGRLSEHATVVDGVLTIPAASQADEAEYYCKGTNTEGTTTVRTILYVTGTAPPVDIVVREPKVEAYPGNTVTLVCTAAGNIVLLWSRQSYPTLPPGSQQQNGVLTIPSVRPAYSGNYICRGTAQTGESSFKVVVLKIVEAPSLGKRPTARVDPERQIVPLGTTGTLRCIVTGVPSPVISWSKARGELPSHVQVDGNILRITRSKMTDRGIYVCRASNSAGRAQAYGIVDIKRQAPPSVELYPKAQQTIPIGGSALFQCRVTGGDPSPTVSWSRANNASFTSNTELMIKNGVIRFMHVKGREQGAYVCTATNTVGTITATATLQIQGGPIISISPSNDIRVREGDSVTVECTAEGAPVPSVQWARPTEALSSLPGDRAPGSASMVFRRITAREAGTYKCIAENSAGRSESSVRILVETRRSTRGLTIPGPNTLSLTEGQTVDLVCSASGLDNPAIHWRRRGGALPPDHSINKGVLTIPSITREYAGEYICTANTPFGTFEATITIIITVLPKLVISPQRVSFRPGSSLVLQCSAGDRSGDITYEWTKVNGALNPSAVVSIDGKLEIARVTAADAGQYKCSASGSAGLVEGYAYVSVIVPPDVVVEQRDFVKVPGEFVEIRCRASGNPPPRITWSKENGQLPAQHRIVNGALAIYNLVAEDTGRYICSASNEAGVSHGYVYLTVRSTDQGSTKPAVKSQTVHVGDRVDFECYVDNASPTPRIIWSKLDGDLPLNAIKSKGVFVIPEVKPEHAGTYECTAENEAGKLKTRVTLIVQARPIISVPQNVRTAALGSETSLSCVSKGSPEPTITWSRRDQDLPSDYKIEKGTLTINRVRRQDAGTYLCSAQNEYGTTDQPVELVVGDLVPYFPQDPVSYMTYAPLSDAYSEFDIGLTFKPQSTEGLLLYNGESADAYGDFFCFGLQNSYPEFRYDVGSGPTIIRGNRSLELNKWHKVSISRKQKRATMQVNDQPAYTGESTGRYVGMTLQSSMYLGAVPDFNKLPKGAGFKTGFVGTVSEMKLQGEPVDIGNDVIDVVGVRQTQVCGESPCQNGGSCKPKNNEYGYSCDCPKGYVGHRCESMGERCYPGACGREGRCYNLLGGRGYTCICPIGKYGPGCSMGHVVIDPAFNKTSFVSYQTIINGLLEMKIRLLFKPRSLDDGIVLYNGHRPDGSGDFVAIIIRNGHIEFRFNTGRGPAILRSRRRLEKDVWVTVQATRKGREGRLIVNNQDPVTGMSPGNTVGINLRLPLYLGGMDPQHTPSPVTGTNIGFVGCIAELTINSRKIHLIKSAVESSNVKGCDDRSPCDKRPCGRHGKCSQIDSHRFICECDPLYTGAKCDVEINVCINKAPCKNGGECIVTSPGYKCMCPLGYGGVQCGNTVKIGTKFAVNGDGYVEVDSRLMPHKRYVEKETLSLTIAMVQHDGVILWQGQQRGHLLKNADYLAVAVVDGRIELSYELGSGAAIIRSSQFVNDSLSHTITVTRRGRRGSLVVDDGKPIEGMSHGFMQILNTRGNIFLGGVPNLERMTDKKYSRNFVGCISNVVLKSGVALDIGKQAKGGYNVALCGMQQG